MSKIDMRLPPADQRVDPSLLDRIRRRIGELTVNVQVLPSLQRDRNGGEYVIVSIPRSVGVASTSDGRYGTDPVLYAQPLAVPACGYSVDRPAAVFPPHWAFSNTVAAAPGDDEIWTVVSYVRNNATADLFRLVPCD